MSAHLLVAAVAPGTFVTLLVTTALLTLGASDALATNRGLVVDRFDATIAIGADGAVEVTETIEVDFGEDEHHGLFRVLPISYPLAPDDTQVQLPEGRKAADFHRVVRIRDVTVDTTAPDDVEAAREDDTFVIRVGDPDATVTGTHVYELRYIVVGAFNTFDDRAELMWNITGHDWEAPIARVSAVVEAPSIVDAACYRGPQGATTPCEQTEVVDDRVEVVASGLSPGEGVTVSVGVPPSVVEVPPPQLEERWRLARALAGSPLTLPLTVLSAAIGLAVITWAARRYGRKHDGPSAHAPGYRGEPPGGLRPAQLRIVTEAEVDELAVSATLFDLAARGYLELEHHDDDTAGYRLRRTPHGGDDLRDWERPLWNSLFTEGDTVTSDELGNDFVDAVRRFREALEEDAVQGGWFRKKPTELRGRRSGVSLGLGVAAGALLAGALAFTTFALAAVPLVLAAGVLIVLLHRQPLCTPQGQQLAGEARAFRAFLASSTASPLDSDDDPSALFGHYLPYAVAFDVAPRWVARFRDLPLPVEQWAPAYYTHPYAAAHVDPDGFAAGLETLGGQVAASTPSPSTSTSGGGGHAGGGFGGGGGGGW